MEGSCCDNMWDSTPRNDATRGKSKGKVYSAYVITDLRNTADDLPHLIWPASIRVEDLTQLIEHGIEMTCTMGTKLANILQRTGATSTLQGFSDYLTHIIGNKKEFPKGNIIFNDDSPPLVLALNAKRCVDQRLESTVVGISGFWPTTNSDGFHSK
eukprot:GHVL01016896.1.p1 GENE.GHVL01016896.1~~GHVL01016896.1.p1  ORF type:complete len:156 (-),score=14.69 GHVL01016896.1:338-805(-)